jgi:prevent-host-death family protein
VAEAGVPVAGSAARPGLRPEIFGYKIVVMKKSARPRRPVKTTSRSGAAATPIAAAEFKAKCLELMDGVRESGVEYVVTKHGRPVAKLVPFTGTLRQPLFGSMAGTVLEFERPFEPIDGDWDIAGG